MKLFSCEGGLTKNIFMWEDSLKTFSWEDSLKTFSMGGLAENISHGEDS